MAPNLAPRRERSRPHLHSHCSRRLSFGLLAGDVRQSPAHVRRAEQ
jgi:hypothetical protein